MGILIWFVVAFIYGSICSLVDRKEIHKIKYTIYCSIGTFLGVVISYRMGIQYLGFDFVTFSLTFFCTLAILLLARIMENMLFRMLKHKPQTTVDPMVKQVPHL